MLADWLESNIILALARLGPTGRRAANSQVAQSMVEYSIIAALIAIVALTAVTALGNDIKGVFEKIAGQVSPLGGGGGG
jgi:Flp pilus assembly pilin Flp